MVSNFGTQVSLYALGLWLYQRQEQIATFAAVAIAVLLAKLLVLPLLGRHLVHWSRRRVMVLANAIGSSCTLLLAVHLLRWGGSAPVVLVCIAVAASAEATLLLCFTTMIPRLVPQDQQGAASGLFASCDGAIVMAAPFCGALLAGSAGLAGVLVLDAVSSLLAMMCTFAVALPNTSEPSRPAPEQSDQPSPHGVRAAVAMLWGQSCWRPLLLMNTVVAGALAAVEVGFPAWVVSSFGVHRLSWAMALGAAAYGLGTQLWARRWANAQPLRWPLLLRQAVLAQGVLLSGAGLFVFEARRGGFALIWFAGVAGFALAVPLVLSALQGLWLRMIPVELQAQLFAGRYCLEWIARLAALLGITLLADRLLTWLMSWPHWPVWLLSMLGTSSGRTTAMALGLVGWFLILPSLLLWRPLGRML